uniref:Uncharacterized protein n=1 Tax=Anguilla anguilla TaxID=7936 RepID=A0A0E9RG06_ANGAN
MRTARFLEKNRLPQKWFGVCFRLSKMLAVKGHDMQVTVIQINASEFNKACISNLRTQHEKS